MPPKADLKNRFLRQEGLETLEAHKNSAELRAQCLQAPNLSLPGCFGWGNREKAGQADLAVPMALGQNPVFLVKKKGGTWVFIHPKTEA